jgi:zinc transporter ZupT
MHSFAGGALFSAVFLHIYPEAMVGIQGEGEITSRWHSGSLIVAGWLAAAGINVSLNILFSTNGVHTHHHGDIELGAVEGTVHTHAHVHQPKEVDTAETKPENAVTPSRRIDGIVWSIIIGDGVHNFVDGVLIAVGFSSCSFSVGWAIVVAVVSHELPTEIADFIIMTKSGLSLWKVSNKNNYSYEIPERI